ncbi:uncharacterized protein LOC111699219 isoform X2 [Eurytemora carolleeae]|uniref:uncharacterized protein LOC111699219 isoform X2 n=1 Tax=Eurytemora carolleeae TaxID=1294199 RepID=UPI000C788638|nr:uncharacterized protein LOC111699219 isoform X2 [Eurytemora carolleeae]|eukprot:XP_023325599.1 uncharacterized protein LOC111699219 isoform X2 [Eurytemora affinis]
MQMVHLVYCPVLPSKAWIYTVQRALVAHKSDGNYLDHWINILVNSIVVLPFMVQVDQLKVLKEAEKKFNFSPDTKLEKKASMKRRQSLLKLSSLVENMREQPQNRPFIDMLLPDMNMFAAPFLYDDIRQEIKDQWWANPRQNLDTKSIQENIRDQGLKRRLDTLQPSFVEENIKVTLNQLEVGGFINVPLLNPAPTKKEYFWLWTLIILENIVALTIEVVNGGVWTSQGHYYSWDIRLTSLGLAFLFLLMYYKRYHILRDLMNGSVWGTWLHYLSIKCYRDLKDGSVWETWLHYLSI